MPKPNDYKWQVRRTNTKRVQRLEPWRLLEQGQGVSTRRCIQCGKDKPPAEFPKDRRTRRCKACRGEAWSILWSLAPASTSAGIRSRTLSPNRVTFTATSLSVYSRGGPEEQLNQRGPLPGLAHARPGLFPDPRGKSASEPRRDHHFG